MTPPDPYGASSRQEHVARIWSKKRVQVVPCNRLQCKIWKCKDHRQYTQSNIVSRIVVVGNFYCKRIFHAPELTGGVVFIAFYLFENTGFLPFSE
jgi:hypothetical protein